MDYLLIKNFHISFAIISISLFVLRSFWSVTNSEHLQQKWVKITPHINDTLLLGCAFYLMTVSGQYPFEQSWLTAKVLALLAYIGIGTIAIKRGRTPQIRLTAAIIAVLTFAYMIAVAISHQAWPFL
jgi:uncharacterized membrane protein SirB2